MTLSDAALAGQPAATKARRELLERQLGVEAGEARVRGLEAKPTENARILREQRVTFEQARRAWNQDRIEAFRPAYLKAVAQFAEMTRRMAALGEALGERGFLESASENAAMFGSEFVLMPLDPKDHPEGYRRHEGFYPNWAGDKTAKEMHNEHAGPAKLSTELERALSLLQTEELETKRLAVVAARTAAQAAKVAKDRELADSNLPVVWTYHKGEPVDLNKMAS